MAKKSAKTRKAAVSRSAAGPKFVNTGPAVKAMKKLLGELNEARRADTGWKRREEFKVCLAVGLLSAAIDKLMCPPKYPGSTPTQSYPRP